MKINILLSIITILLLFACEPKKKGYGTWELNQMDSNEIEKLLEQNELTTHEQQDSVSEEATSETEQSVEQPHHFICYKSDANTNLAISISFDKEEKALKVKYKGQNEAMNLSFVKEDYLEGGAHPTIETYYSEIYEGKENGVYKLSHSGNWDYAEYTRSKDGNKFNFTIDHELTIENDGYRTTPCY